MTPRGSLRRTSDRGQAAIEFLGVIPWMILGLLAVLQLTVVAATVQGAGTAARAGARSVSQKGDAQTSARHAVPSWLADRITVTVGGGDAPQVSVTAQIPIVLPGVSGPTVTRRAWFDPEHGQPPWG